MRHVRESLRLRGSQIQGGILSAIFSPELLSFANREAPHSSGSGPCRGLHARAAWAPLELTEGTKRRGAQRAGVIQAYVLSGSSRSQTYLSVYLSIYLSIYREIVPSCTAVAHLPIIYSCLLYCVRNTSDRVVYNAGDLSADPKRAFRMGCGTPVYRRRKTISRSDGET
jgi:hypothetical protein